MVKIFGFWWYLVILKIWWIGWKKFFLNGVVWRKFKSVGCIYLLFIWYSFFMLEKLLFFFRSWLNIFLNFFVVLWWVKFFNFGDKKLIIFVCNFILILGLDNFKIFLKIIWLINFEVVGFLYSLIKVVRVFFLLY